MAIKRLSKETINLISAGEVIEAPADVLKELLENSADAKSTEIAVEIKDSGIELIKIKDNGVGISKQDLEICLEKYTTSKLSSIDDLYSLNSFGFRGEALSSIDAVSNLRIVSSTEDSGKGYENVKGEIKETSTNKGTIIEIKNLFNNIPVRKKFLKSKSYEFSRLYDAFLSQAIINPNITYKFNSEKKNIVFPSTDFENRLIQIFGKDIKQKTFFIDVDNEFFKLKGIVGNPTNPMYFPTNFLFINKRYVYSTQINKAIADSYKDYLMIQQKPFFVLFLEINPKTVDVNVHPKKKFIKLQNQMLFLSELKKELSVILDNRLGKEAAQVAGSLKDFAKKDYTESSFSQGSSFNRPQSFSSTSYNPRPSVPQRNTQTFFESENTQEQETNLFGHRILKILGQVHNMFILCETEKGMILVDQHAADERINLEKNRVDFSKSFEKQNLISSKKLDLKESQIETLENNKELVKSLGFGFEQKQNDFYLTTVPMFLNRYFDENIFSNLLTDLETGEDNIEKLKDNLIKLKSCKQSIKANQELTIPEQKELLRKLSSCKDKGICAHGRPTIIYLSVSDLDKMFKRIV